jgi:hypothetical protein
MQDFVSRQHIQCGYLGLEQSSQSIRALLICHCCLEVVHDVVGLIFIVLLYSLKVIACGGPAVDAWVPAAHMSVSIMLYGLGASCIFRHGSHWRISYAAGIPGTYSSAERFRMKQATHIWQRPEAHIHSLTGYCMVRAQNCTYSRMELIQG